MHPQLSAIIQSFESAQRRLDELSARLSDEQWSKTIDPTRWTPAQCLQHLNLTSQAYIPLLQEGLAKARELNGTAPSRYRFDLFGWMVWKASGPTRGFGKVRTAAAFVPQSDNPRAQILEEFAQLQKQQMQLVTEGDGLRLGKIKMVSPFNARIRYNLFSAFSILPAHQHRHLGQAERAAATPAAA